MCAILIFYCTRYQDVECFVAIMANKLRCWKRPSFCETMKLFKTSEIQLDWVSSTPEKNYNGVNNVLRRMMKKMFKIPIDRSIDWLIQWFMCFCRTAALFILASVRVPESAKELVGQQLHHTDVANRTSAILRFSVLWRFRHQVWPRLEYGAHLHFKVCRRNAFEMNC